MKKVLIFIFFAIIWTMARQGAYAQVLEGPPRDGVYDKTTTAQVTPIPYCYLREADIVWTKRLWRTIDLREKLNQPFYFPEVPQNNWKSFMQIIWDGLKEGTITAYSPENDLFATPITFKEIQDRIEQTDTVYIPDPDNPDVKVMKVVKSEFSAMDVKKFQIKEDWYFDRQRSVMEVRILGICPVIEKIVKGVSRGNQQMFWIYFPECRNLFAKNEMFNLRNGAAGRLSYDDVFMKRMFNSYVYKEENVYDRSIAEYAAGVDALMESERAKNSLLEFEETLWEY
jgi:gliding motility associated protien GldN